MSAAAEAARPLARLDTHLARLRPHAPNLQFWGYEGGNLLAALAGAGGLAMLHAEDPAALLAHHPDVAVVLGLGVIVVGLGALALVRRALGHAPQLPAADRAAAAAGALLIGAALAQGTDWMVTAALCFVSGSALLRLCDRRPDLLRPGGLLLAAGGACLGAAGLAGPPGAVGALTALTGYYVAVAGLMTYRAGVGPAPSLADRAVLGLLARVGEPSLFWIPPATRRRRPLYASMWARLPFRAALALAALAAPGEPGLLLAAACVLWALGDLAIGALDADAPFEAPATARGAR